MDVPFPVAFDVGPLSGPRTGVGVAVAGMREALEARQDVTLLPYQISFRARLTLGAWHPTLGGVHTLPVPAAVAHRWWERASRPRVDRWWSAARVVHGTNYVVPPSRRARLVSVYDTWFLRHPEAASADVARSGRILRRSIAEGAAVHTSSQATADSLAELFPRVRVEVVHLGAVELDDPPPTCALAARLPRPFVVALGTVEQRKNLPRLVTAAGRTADQFDLVIAGRPGDDQPAVDAAVDALPPTQRGRIIVAGAVDAPTKAWLLHHAAALAYPSLDEGFGFPLLEAMRAGLPIVASTAGSIPEVAGDAAVLCSPTDIDALAEALSTVLDGDRRAALIAAGDRRWREFDWAHCAAGLVALYHRLVESPS